jgi:mycoredoxin
MNNSVARRKIVKRLLILLLAGIVLCGLPAFAAGNEKNLLQKDPSKSYGAIDVILYQTSWCPYCTKARELLQDMGVSLVIHDIEKDESKRAEMMVKSGGSRGVPLIDVEGIVIRGYSPEEIKSAIEKQRRK